MKKSGLYWHVHHDLLVEFCYDYDERVRFIEFHKPSGEIESRLKVFQPVRGKLSKNIQKTGLAHSKAYRIYHRVWREFYAASPAAYAAASQAYYEAGLAYSKARRTYIGVLQTHRAEIEELHAKECPDCTWNGERLVFAQENEL